MLSLFKKNSTKSTTALITKNKIMLADKELLQELILTDRFVLMRINGKEVLFDPARDENYLVDKEAKVLKAIDDSEQQLKMNQFKSLIGSVKVEFQNSSLKFNGFACREIKLANEAEKIALTGTLLLTKHPDLEKTVYNAFYRKQQQTGFYTIDLQPDEIVVSVNVDLTVNGNVQHNQMELISIEPLTETADIDTYLNFKVKN